MHYFFNIFFKFRFFIFFILLELLIVILFFSNSRIYEDIISFEKNKIHELIHVINNHILLKKENEKLLNENKRLHNESIYSNLNRFKNDDLEEKNRTKYLQRYTFIPANIINNSINRHENYIIINKGSLNGIKEDMGVVLPNGIAGIVVKTTPHFSNVISILNSKIKINARLKKNKCFGSLGWDGVNYRYVILYDISKHCNVNKGDIIETDGKSSTFPEGIPIGKVVSFSLDENKSSYVLKIKLFSDFSSIDNAYVVKNLFEKEWNEILNKN